MKLNQKNNFMNDLNPSRKPVARTRSGGLLALMLTWPVCLALATPLRADNPPTFIWVNGGSSGTAGTDNSDRVAKKSPLTAATTSMWRTALILASCSKVPTY